MKVLRVKSGNLEGALAEARRQLGVKAVVLHTKQFEEPTWFGLRRKYMVEILAAADTSGFHEPVAVASAEHLTPDTDIRGIAQQIAEMREALARIDSTMKTSGAQPPSAVVERLIANGVARNLAESFVSQEDLGQDRSRILEVLARRVRASGPLKCDSGQARVALVGPTGAGKTTTAAKLAAQYALIHKNSVALLTLDTYRVGAVEQLGAYARILDLPLEVAMCPEDVDAQIAKHQDKDIIIIDTVGRSPRNRREMGDLNRLLVPSCPTETHLVISASSSPAAQKEAVDAFSRLSADRLILTKADECPQLGCILNLAATSLLPFSYVAFGQEVPDDIGLADEQWLSQLVWEGSL